MFNLYFWAAPRLPNVAISDLYWELVTLIDVSFWLIDTTLQYMNKDVHAIALHVFAHAHAPLPEFPALCPASVPLALPSMLLPLAPAPEVLDDIVPALVLCPAVLPMAFSTFLDEDHSIRGWLTAALPLAITPFIADAVAVSPAGAPVATENSKAAPVVQKFRQSKRLLVCHS